MPGSLRVCVYSQLGRKHLIRNQYLELRNFHSQWTLEWLPLEEANAGMGEFSVRKVFLLFLSLTSSRILLFTLPLAFPPGIPPNKYHYIDDLVVILPQNVWEYLYNRWIWPFHSLSHFVFLDSLSSWGLSIWGTIQGIMPYHGTSRACSTWCGLTRLVLGRPY